MSTSNVSLSNEFDIASLVDNFDTIFQNVPSPYRLTRRTNIAYNPEMLEELKRDIQEHNEHVMRTGNDPVSNVYSTPPSKPVSQTPPLQPAVERYNNSMQHIYDDIEAEEPIMQLPQEDFADSPVENVSALSQIGTSDEETAMMLGEDIDADIESLKPIPMVRQTNKCYRFLVYSNGLLIDENGNPTTLEENNLTNEFIAEELQHQRGLDIQPDECIIGLEHDLETNQILPIPGFERQNTIWHYNGEVYPDAAHYAITVPSLVLDEALANDVVENVADVVEDDPNEILPRPLLERQTTFGVNEAPNTVASNTNSVSKEEDTENNWNWFMKMLYNQK
jgi:hypothetical protein